MSVRPPRRPDWNGWAIYASGQGALFGALAIGYGALGRNPGEELAGLLLLGTGILCGWYSRRRRPVGERGPLRRPSLRFSRPPRKPLAVWLWVVAGWCALALSAIAPSPAVGGAAIVTVFFCIFACAILEMRG